MSDLAQQVTLRAATAKDSELIRRLIRAARLDPTSLHWPNFTCACDESGKVVGVAQIKPFADCREFGSLVVLPSWRGRGVAALLIEAVVGAERGDCWLMCRDALEPFYARYGFKRERFSTSPRTLRLKLGVSKVMLLFGIRIISMRRLPAARRPD